MHHKSRNCTSEPRRGVADIRQKQIRARTASHAQSVTLASRCSVPRGRGREKRLREKSVIIVNALSLSLSLSPLIYHRSERVTVRNESGGTGDATDADGRDVDVGWTAILIIGS